MIKYQDQKSPLKNRALNLRDEKKGPRRNNPKVAAKPKPRRQGRAKR